MPIVRATRPAPAPSPPTAAAALSLTTPPTTRGAATFRGRYVTGPRRVATMPPTVRSARREAVSRLSRRPRQRRGPDDPATDARPRRRRRRAPRLPRPWGEAAEDRHSRVELEALDGPVCPRSLPRLRHLGDRRVSVIPQRRQGREQA